MTIRILAALVIAVSALTACSSGMNAAVQTMQDAVKGKRSVTDARLNPNFRYLRVTIDGRVAFLALGSEDKHPQGPVEVWFSAQREVVRLQNGRVIGAAGLTTEWRNVVLPALPSWSTVAHDGHPVQWVRMRDVMPGYRFGVRDEISLRSISAPRKSALQGVDPQSLTWFEEQIQSGSRAALFVSVSSDKPLPPAHYAVDLRGGKEVVVYGEQCLAPELCFTWQRWNPEKP